MTVALGLAGCLGTSPTARFYHLTPLEEAGADAPEPDAPEPAASEASAAAASAVHVAAVDLPEYLRVPQIVTRIGGNELALAEYQRWGEPLEANLGDVLARNLTQLLPDRPVTTPRWGPGGAQQVVRVAVTRFEAEAGTVTLEALWSVAAPRTPAEASTRSVYQQPVERSEDRYRAVVRAMSAAVADLARDVAAAIESR
ncbi:MAG: PqiC family protein [Planctomycetota bacterium]